MTTEKPTRPKMTLARAEAVLAEYPDADLTAFDIEGNPDVDALAAEVAGRTINRIRARLNRPHRSKR